MVTHLTLTCRSPKSHGLCKSSNSDSDLDDEKPLDEDDWEITCSSAMTCAQSSVSGDSLVEEADV